VINEEVQIMNWFTPVYIIVTTGAAIVGYFVGYTNGRNDYGGGS